MKIIKAIAILIASVFVAAICSGLAESEDAKMRKTDRFTIGNTDFFVQDRDIDDVLVKKKNLLNGLHYDTGYVYDVNNSAFEKTAVSGFVAYDVIEIEKGKTYYYRYLRPYFSKIIYDGGGSYRLDSSESKRYGSFTATDFGRIGLATTPGITKYAIFTDDISVFNGFNVAPVNELSSGLIVPQVEEVTNNPIYFMDRVNLLEGAETVINKGYERGSTNLTDNNALAAIVEPIHLDAGVTYYYRNIWAYFCQFRDGEGTISEITNDESGMASGSFTPTKSGYLFISLQKASRAASPNNPDKVDKFLLTTSKEMYDDNVWHTQERNYEFHVDGNSNLVSTILEANKYMDSVVYVSGEHDLIDELEEVYGSGYIETINSSKRGIYLKNRIRLIFSSDASITCDYTGSTADVMTWLAAFNAGQHGFTIENARISGSNLRYIIHDERDQDTDQYTNSYINCRMYFDNSENSNWSGNNCIGGGLGRNGHIIIDGCYFESVRRAGQSDTSQNARGIVTYHNSAGTGVNKIEIKNCYIANVGTVRVTWYGTSTEKTVAMISGCSFGSEIIFRAEDSSATIENVELIAWNNEIRAN